MALPKYHLTKEILKEQIINGKFKPNDRFLSVREIIQDYSVSRVTAFRILNELSKEGFVSIRNGVGTFVRDRSSQTRDPENNIVLVTFAENFTNQFHLNVLNGAKKCFSKQDCNIMYEWVTLNSWNKEPNKKEFSFLKTKLTRMKKDNKILGMILTGTLSGNTAEALKGTGIPCVVAGDLSEPEIPDGLDIIGNDSFLYAYKAVKYLTGLKHKRIGCIIDDANVSWLHERLRGYKTALKDAGLAIEKELIIPAPGGKPDKGYLAMKQLLKLKNPPTAVFCGDDRITMGAMKAVAELGLKIPENLSIIAISSSEETEYYYPKLTFIRYLPRKVGETAVKTLLDKIKNKTTHKEKRVLIEAEFVEGTSCKRIIS
ncbi:MAG: hypothetical protein A2297_09605 [Elusimicrobia bacterium RIFOXYB2_FULL_48_7]|nr:MAG: hypothetical protein A2297_09605 [Elusimicrobia bacterium RIFOXYB2_FULL_48_7]